MAQRNINRLINRREPLDPVRIKEIELAKTIEDLEASGAGDLLSTNNLSDVANAATARTNLGLGIGVNVPSYFKTVVTKAVNYTIVAADEIVLVNGTYTMTLPTAVGAAGKIYCVKNIGSGTATVDGDGAETIDGSASIALAPMEALLIVSDDTEWWII